MKTNSEDLTILLAVVDTGSFTAAANMLNIQASKVSRAVNRIEQSLQVTILNRTTRRVELTEEGRTFIANIREGLALIEKAEGDITASEQGPAGRLRVDAASPFVNHQLVPLVAEFTQTYPQIELEISSNEGYVDLLEHRTDVAIRIGGLTDSTLHARLLGKSRLFIVAAPSYIDKCMRNNNLPTQVSDLANHRLIGFTGPKILNEWPIFNTANNAQSILKQPLKHAVYCSSGETVRQLVLAGNGIACLSGFMVKQDIEAGRLQTLFDANGYEHKTRSIVNGVYYKSSTVSRRISAFLDFIQPRLQL